MMYLLDTNIITYWMRGDVGLINRIRRHSVPYLHGRAGSETGLEAGRGDRTLNKHETVAKLLCGGVPPQSKGRDPGAN